MALDSCASRGAPRAGALSIHEMIGLRAFAEHALLGSGVARWRALGRRGRTIVLAYHNVVPDDARVEGDRSLHLARAAFADQLDVLRESCDVVPLTAILTDPLSDSRARVAITFDDAYRGALTLAAPELRARRLPATMFVTPGLLGEEGFWWDRLAQPRGLSDAVRDRAINELRGDGEAVRAWALSAGLPVRQCDPWERPGSEAEVSEWARQPGLSLGAHTWRHLNLARLTNADLATELAKPIEWLSARFRDRSIAWLTYPYGLATPAVATAAKATGYHAALAVTGGWMPRPVGDPYWLPRLNIPGGVTLAGFRLRLAGVIGTGVAQMQQ